MAHIEALSPLLGDRVWSQGEIAVEPKGVPIIVDMVGKQSARSASTRIDHRVASTSLSNPPRYRSRPRAGTADGTDAPRISPDNVSDPSLATQGSVPHSLRRRRSRRNSRSSRRQSSQGPPTIKDATQLPYVYLENCSKREFEIIMMISDILWERGDSPVGLLGTRLHAKTQDHNLPTHFKEAYGGLKKFVSRWPSLFVLHTDHRYNPKVGLLGWPKSTIYTSRPPSGAPFAATNGGAQGGARARRRRANKAFQQAGARRVNGNFASLPSGFSPYSQAQTLSHPYTTHARGTPYLGILDPLASHERSFALSPTRDRAATYSGFPSPPMRHHDRARTHALSSYSPTYSNYSHGHVASEGEFVHSLPPHRSHSPPRKMQVEIGDPFDDLVLEDYFLSGGRSHAASDPGPRPYIEPSHLDMPPSSMGYPRHARYPAQNPSEIHVESRPASGVEGHKSVLPQTCEAPGGEKSILSKEMRTYVSNSSSPSSKSNSGASSSSDALLHPPPSAKSSEGRESSTKTTPSPSSRGHVVTKVPSGASVAQQACMLRVRAMKMHAAAQQDRPRVHLAPGPEFAFVEEDNMFGLCPTTRARSRSYDVASASVPGLHLPTSPPHYAQISVRHTIDPHLLAPLPPLTPPYATVPLTPRNPAVMRVSPREREAMERAYDYIDNDSYHDTSPLTNHSDGTFFPRTQPLPQRGGNESARSSGHTEFTLAHMMSGLSVEGKQSEATQNTKSFSFAPTHIVGGRSRSVSSPGAPKSVLNRNTTGGTISARPQALVDKTLELQPGAPGAAVQE